MSAAGVHDAADAADGYFEHVRPELLALVPEDARTSSTWAAGPVRWAPRSRRARAPGSSGWSSCPRPWRWRPGAWTSSSRPTSTRSAELPLEDGSVDAFVFGDVLEHLRDPQRLLALVQRHLAPDGVIVCSIPNVRHWSVVAPLLIEDRFTYTQAGLLDRTHVHLFTLAEIDDMLRATGYAVVQLGATTHAMPAHFAPLAQIVGRYGGDVDQATARLQAYQYLVVARRA